MENKEIVTEVRELHSRFHELAEQYETTAQPAQRAELRERMEPLVTREQELRQEYTGRATQEVRIDRAPDIEIGYSR